MSSVLSSLARLVTLVILLAYAADQSASGDRKCLPKQWEGKVFGQVAQIDNGEGKVLDVVAGMSVDYTIGRQMLTEVVYMEKEPVAVLKILTAANQSYYADMLKRKCTKLPGAPVIQLCSDTTGLVYRASWTMGTQMTDTYNINMGASGNSTLTFTRDPFTVVSSQVVVANGAHPEFSSMQMGNVTAGIEDPSVFDLPYFCTTSDIGTAKPPHWSRVFLPYL